MSQQATKSLIMAIIHKKFRDSSFLPAQIHNILRSEHNINIEIGDVIFLLDGMENINAIPPSKLPSTMAWTYKLVTK